MIKKINNLPLVFNASNFSLIKVSGDDAQNFLDNQLTVNVPVENNLIIDGAWCNPKGRVITSIHIMRHDNAYYLMALSEVEDILVKRLNLYKMRAKVIVEVIKCSPIIVFNDEGAEMFGRFAEGAFKGYGLTNNTTTEEIKDEWSDYLIATGFPLIGLAQSEKWIAQQLNMEALAMIDFKKGCYPGQEVIARIHFKGAVKKQLKLISAEELADLNQLLNGQDVLNVAKNKVNGQYFAQVIETV